MSMESALRKIAEEKKAKTGKLNLGGEYLSKIPEEILELDHLQSLYIHYNGITNTHLLKGMVNLQVLNLRNNKIIHVDFLENLTKLQSLNLSINEITSVDIFIHLNNLQDLNISCNPISDYSFLKNLSDLQSLDLHNNKISDISFLGNLTNLRSLNLSKNNIFYIRFLENLTNLESLDLSENQISNIEPLLPLIKSGKMEVTIDRFNSEGRIDLRNNPITNPPLEIVAKGNQAIIKYFEDLAQQGSDYLYEAKMLIVGDGGVGKTSLAWKMEDLQSYMPEEGNDRTKGIDIQALSIQNIKDTDKPFLMNVWDFGGQGYYHSTHQFFLTKRSLYVIVNNTRSNKTDFNHWLQTISLFSEDSPVIIVENEVGGAKSELDLRGLQQHFSNILYVREADISNIIDGRLEKLIGDLEIEVQRLPHVGSELPKQWVKIREELAEVAQKEAYISDKAFYKICQKHQIVKREAIQRLGDLFHDLGIFLHFRSDEVLRRTVILQNTWATKGVYEILDSGLVRKQKGYFTIEQAETIWADTQFEDMHHELVRLMTKFELCYRIPYTQNPVAYISPNLLPTEKPDYEWNAHQNLLIYYQYEFMPKGLLGRLIVRMHRYVKDIEKMAWRNGCVFEYEGTEAQVVETYGGWKDRRLGGRFWGFRRRSNALNRKV